MLLNLIHFMENKMKEDLIIIVLLVIIKMKINHQHPLVMLDLFKYN